MGNPLPIILCKTGKEGNKNNFPRPAIYTANELIDFNGQEGIFITNL
jgi:hypothetical protein